MEVTGLFIKAPKRWKQFHRAFLFRIRITDFFYRTIKGKEYLFVSIDKSKGGRNRISLVRPDKQREVEKIIEDRRANNQEKLCPKVHSAMDVHSYRRDYERELYKNWLMIEI